ncbi:MAG: GyrI-like domain-containing protein [Thermomicrobiales bacterium]
MQESPPEIARRPELQAMIIRTRAAVQDLPRIFGEAFAELGAYLGEAGVAPTGRPFAAYHNMDMEDLDLEIGFPVAASLPGRGRIQSGSVPGGQWITAVHIGPYDQMTRVYDRLLQEIQAKGLVPTGVAYEFYDSPPDTPPEQTRTEVGFPLK